MIQGFGKVKLVLVATSFALMALSAQSDDTAIVKNSFDNIIRNSFGNCIRTKWVVGMDECAGEKIRPVVKNVQMPDLPSFTKIYKPKEHSRSYLVFFDFDKSEVTPDANGIIRSLADAAKQKNAEVFELTGHADRVGTYAYNMSLSEKRSAAVKKELMNLGYKPAQVTTYAKGESEPLVPTEDGVKEPQNRRVEIIFKYKE